MKIYQNIKLSDSMFFKSNIRDILSYFHLGELDKIEVELEKLYPNGVTISELTNYIENNLDKLAEWLGYENWEDFIVTVEYGECYKCEENPDLVRASKEVNTWEDGTRKTVRVCENCFNRI